MDTNRNYFSHIAAFAVGIMIMLWLRGCSEDCGKTTTNVKVKVPEVKGSFTAKKPDHVPVTGEVVKGQKLSNSDKSKKDKSEASDNHEGSTKDDSLINELLAENEKLSRDFYFANDSLKKLKYQKAIQLNVFSKTFEDKNIKIDMSGIVRGEVQSIQPFYTIKEREIKTDIRQKEVKFRMLAGGGFGNTLVFDNANFKANLGFQNQKGNVLRVSYDTQQRVWVEYDFSVFKISK